MIQISKESLAPRLFERRKEEHRATACWHEVEIVYCLYLCGGIRKHVRLEEIAGQAWITYPQIFATWVNGENVPDLALIHMTLERAGIIESFVTGDWNRGWLLTARGRHMAGDIDRRRTRHSLFQSPINSYWEEDLT